MFSATATALEVEPVISTALFSVMKRCCGLHRLVRLGGGVGDADLHFLAEHALAGLGRDLLDQLVAAVDVLDRELPALELVLALHGVGAGARHRDADEHR